MIISINTLLFVSKVLLAVSLFFVWVVRYENIKKEFINYKLPKWLRDLVGILKLSFSAMILFNDTNLVMIGCLGIIFLMIGAIVTHFRAGNPFLKMIPAISLSFLCAIILYYSL